MDRFPIFITNRIKTINDVIYKIIFMFRNWNANEQYYCFCSIRILSSTIEKYIQLVQSEVPEFYHHI